MAIELPTEKQAPSLSPETMKALLYGPPKVGKTTFAANMDPDHTLILATEPGVGAMEVYTLAVTSWTELLEIGAALSADPKHYRTLVIDTIDELYRLCADHVCTGLGVRHPSDLEYGKGWGMVADEFRLRLGKLAGLGLGVWFISHAKDQEVNAKIGKVTKTIPTVQGQARSYVVGFCDFIFLAGIEHGEEGQPDERVLYTTPTANHDVGGRIPEGAPPLPDPLPLDPAALRAAMQASFGTGKKSPPAKPKQQKPEANGKAPATKATAKTRVPA